MVLSDLLLYVFKQSCIIKENKQFWLNIYFMILFVLKLKYKYIKTSGFLNNKKPNFQNLLGSILIA